MFKEDLRPIFSPGMSTKCGLGNTLASRISYILFWGREWLTATICRGPMAKFLNRIPHYYLGRKNHSVCLHAYLRLESTNHKKICETIKALPICKRLTQTASL